MVQIIFVILTIVLMYEVWIYILKPIVTLPIAKVEIISLSEEVDNNEIDRIVSDAIKDNSVFTVDVNNIITNINALPWVKSVHFIRKYPDFLSIEVDSQSPVAKMGRKRTFK
jgi:Cell division septal protein